MTHGRETSRQGTDDLFLLSKVILRLKVLDKASEKTMTSICVFTKVVRLFEVLPVYAENKPRESPLWSLTDLGDQGHWAACLPEPQRQPNSDSSEDRSRRKPKDPPASWRHGLLTILQLSLKLCLSLGVSATVWP